MKKTPSCRFGVHAPAFTLVEVLVSVSVLAVMMIIIAEMMKRTQDTISTASSHATEYQEARRALDAMTSTLAQATMDTVWTYRSASADPTSITGYERSSDHHFVLAPAAELQTSGAEIGQAVFFQAPLGEVDNAANNRLHQLLNCCGFYVQYSSDLTTRPTFLQSGQPVQANPERKRFRLMQYMQPAEDSILYSAALALNQASVRSQALRWFQDDLAEASQPIADNVLALVLTPYEAYVNPANGDKSVIPDADYHYDSREYQWSGLNDETRPRRHQLPAMVGITLIMADERSYEALALRLGEEEAANAVRAVLAGKFTSHPSLEQDLAAVESGLGELKLHHQIIKASVSLRNTQWISKDES